MRKWIATSAYLLAILLAAGAQQCSQYNTCKTCLAEETVCSWCEATNTCIDKAGSEGQCTDVFTFKQQCDDSCSGRTELGCEDCECVWCFDTAQCWSGNLTAPNGPITCSRHRYTCSYAEETIKVLVILFVAIVLTAVIGLGLWMVYRKQKGLRPWPFGKRHEYDNI
jgi:hypothetical protein